MHGIWEPTDAGITQGLEAMMPMLAFLCVNDRGFYNVVWMSKAVLAMGVRSLAEVPGAWMGSMSSITPSNALRVQTKALSKENTVGKLPALVEQQRSSLYKTKEAIFLINLSIMYHACTCNLQVKQILHLKSLRRPQGCWVQLNGLVLRAESRSSRVCTESDAQSYPLHLWLSTV